MREDQNADEGEPLHEKDDGEEGKEERLGWEGLGYSPEAYSELEGDEEEPLHEKYLKDIIKSPFGLQLISHITEWVDNKDNKHESPFTVKTQQTFFHTTRVLIDQAEFLQNLSDPNKERIAMLLRDKLLNVLQISVDRMDTEKGLFYLVPVLLEKHSHAITTRATGMDRERILQARRIIEQIVKQMYQQPQPSGGGGFLSRFLGRR